MNRKAMRIVSLVPSITELLSDLGLNDEVVGITKFCIHPDHWFRNKTRIGGTKNLHIDRIQALHPDIIFANKEENVKEQVELLSNNFPVHVTDVHHVEAALDMILNVSVLCHKEAEGALLVERFRDQELMYQVESRKSVLYLIWQKPFMAVGADTFIHSMLALAGYDNIITQYRYPEVSENQINELNPEYIFLSSEPYPFKQKHIDELSTLWPSSRIHCVDGEIFSWYGSRMLKSFDYFRTLNEQLA